MVSSRATPPTPPSIVAGPAPYPSASGLAPHLSRADVTVAPSLSPQTVELQKPDSSTVTATYLTGPQGVVTNPAQPVLPLSVSNVTVEGTVLRGVGETHLAIALERLERKFGVRVDTEDVRVAYRETITATATATGRHKKQSGGHGQYAVCEIEVEPLPVDHPYRKLDNVVLTPHLGYVSEQNYRKYFPDIVEDIRAFLEGKPVRVIAP